MGHQASCLEVGDYNISGFYLPPNLVCRFSADACLLVVLAGIQVAFETGTQ
jgi:hypothetical protein